MMYLVLAKNNKQCLSFVMKAKSILSKKVGGPTAFSENKVFSY